MGSHRLGFIVIGFDANCVYMSIKNKKLSKEKNKSGERSHFFSYLLLGR
jgi:hypothetical protein